MCRSVATGKRAARSRRSALGACRPAPTVGASAFLAALSPGSGTTTQSSGRGRRGGAADPQWWHCRPSRGRSPSHRRQIPRCNPRKTAAVRSPKTAPLCDAPRWRTRPRAVPTVRCPSQRGHCTSRPGSGGAPSARVRSRSAAVRVDVRSASGLARVAPPRSAASRPALSLGLRGLGLSARSRPPPVPHASSSTRREEASKRSPCWCTNARSASVRVLRAGPCRRGGPDSW